jgi:hypothetical protein
MNGDVEEPVNGFVYGYIHFLRDCADDGNVLRDVVVDVRNVLRDGDQIGVQIVVHDVWVRDDDLNRFHGDGNAHVDDFLYS